MVLLTFLGRGTRNGYYEPARYRWKEKNPVETCWIAEACVKIFDIDKVYVVATQEAQDKTWPNLQRALKDKCDVSLIPIKDGKSEAELWEIYESILAPIPEGAELVFDITHGFRSQPLIALAIAIYLRILKSVSVRHIVYGAWEATVRQTGITPIFALDAFLELIDWTFAIWSFRRSGDAELLRSILEDTQRRYYVSKDSEIKSSTLPRRLSSLAKSIYNVSQALHLLRPGETGTEVKNALDLLEESKEELRRFAKPLLPLADHLEAELKPLDYGEITTETSILSSQLSMIEWFLSKKKFSHAITLAREWGVNYFAVLRGLNPAVNNHRKLAEKWLNQLIYDKDSSETSGILDSEFVDLYRQIQNHRNEINHANDMQPADKLAKNIENVCRRLLIHSEDLLSKL